MKKNLKGFTLIELLIVIAIIGFIAAAILVAVDPVKRIQDSRDAKRWSEVNGMLNAVLNKQVDARADYTGDASAPVISGLAAGVGQVIVSSLSGVDCTATTPTCAAVTAPVTGGASALTRCVANMTTLAPDYIAEIPVDARGSAAGYTASNTGYYISKNTAGRITIGSCSPEGQNVVIKVQR